MKSGVRLALLLCVAAPGATGAQASGRGDGVDANVVRLDGVVRTMAQCVVKRLPTRAREVLRTVPYSNDEARIFATFQSRMDWCLPLPEGGLQFTNGLLRGKMAEIVFRQDFPAGMPRVADPALAIAWGAQPVGGTALAPRSRVNESARCVVAKMPDDAAAFVVAEPFSTREMAALTPLMPTLSACLDTGVKARFSRQMIRAVIAQAVYDYARAARDGFASTTTAAPAKTAGSVTR